jgi:hypothetical protein
MHVTTKLIYVDNLDSAGCNTRPDVERRARADL